MKKWQYENWTLTTTYGITKKNQREFSLLQAGDELPLFVLSRKQCDIFDIWEPKF